jgi:hypothetical protein
MSDLLLLLTGEERDFLAEHLNAAWKHLQIEEHRTRNLSFREQVTHDKELLEQILAKLEAAAVPEAGAAAAS